MSLVIKFVLLVLIVTLSSSVSVGVRITADIPPDECGYFKTAKQGDTGKIKSPNYPSNYPNKALCIWLLEAEIGWKFEVTIPSMNGQYGDGGNTTCSDYVEVRSGSSDSRQEYFECNSDTSTTFSTKSRWLWIKFESDESTRNTGFKAEWKLKKDKGNEFDRDPVKRCRPGGRGVTLECANKECVPWAYVCDNKNDCGCTGEGCDEEDSLCGGLGLSQGTIIGLGITIGFAIFVPIFLGIGFIDIYLKKKAEKDLDKKIKEAKLRDKQKKLGNLMVGNVPGAASRPTTAVAGKK